MLKHDKAVISEFVAGFRLRTAVIGHRLRLLGGVGDGPNPSTTYKNKSSHPDSYFFQL